MRNKILFLIFILIFFFYSATNKVFNIKLLKYGDIIFQETFGEQSKALKLVTHSKYTHVGIIVYLKNKIYVLEAIEPVKITPLDEFISRGKNKHFVIKRLYNNKLFTEEGKNKFWKNAQKYMGFPYDYTFEWDDKRIYCTELVWKLYKQTFNIQICGFKKYKNFDLSSSFIKKILIKRFGNLKKIPMEEKVIPPSIMFNSNKLKTIFIIN